MGISIEARRVAVHAGMVSILSDISFTLWPGEVLSILGPSGAGKSTLFKALNGYRRPDRGSVHYEGMDLYEHLSRFRRSIGYVPQDDVVHGALTARDALFYSGRLRLSRRVDDRAVEQRAAQVLNMLELADRARVRVKRLSGGQRKRVNLGIELMTRPPVLFLDEPTSGLDPALEEKTMHLFKALAREGRTVVLTTHVMDTLSILDRVLVLCKGQLTFLGTPADALRFFQVEDFADIYRRLSESGGSHWRGRFLESPYEARANAPRAGPGPDRAVFADADVRRERAGTRGSRPHAEPAPVAAGTVEAAAEPPRSSRVDGTLSAEERIRQMEAELDEGGGPR